MQATLAYDIPYLQTSKKKAEEKLKFKSTGYPYWGAITGLIALIRHLLPISGSGRRKKK